MDHQGTDSDTIRQKIEALVAKKDFRAAVVQCEELEILVRHPSLSCPDLCVVHMAVPAAAAAAMKIESNTSKSEWLCLGFSWALERWRC